MSRSVTVTTADLFLRNTIIGYTDLVNTRFTEFNTDVTDQFFTTDTIPTESELVTTHGLDLYLIGVLDPTLFNDLLSNWYLISKVDFSYVPLSDLNSGSDAINYPNIGANVLPLTHILVGISSVSQGRDLVANLVSTGNASFIGPPIGDCDVCRYIINTNSGGMRVLYDNGETAEVVQQERYSDLDGDIKSSSDINATAFIIRGIRYTFSNALPGTYTPGSGPDPVEFKTVIALGIIQSD